MATVAELAEEATSTPDAARLSELSQHPSRRVRIPVASNTHAGDATIAALLGDHDEVVRLACAGNLAERPALQRRVAESSEPWMRANLAATYAHDDERSLPRDIQDALSQDDHRDTRMTVARTTDIRSIYERLLADPDPKVRGACAFNPRATRDDIERLISDRVAATRSLAVSGGLAYPDDEQLERLARDRSVNVRWAVIFRVGAPRSALEWIAENDDETNSGHARTRLDHGQPASYVESVMSNRARVRSDLTFRI